VIPKPIAKVQVQAPVVLRAPPPPPINLKFFGFANKPGEAKKIFLSQGEDVFIAGEGDMSIAATRFCTSRRCRWKWKMC